MAQNKDYKQIRIFLSSTFRDMQKERDALVKLFRQLAVEGRKHRISITLLDLRWGITDDQKRNGMVISTCLSEIDNSRPFFIGLLGQRYGWVPSGEELKSADLFVKFPRLQYYADKGMSITEIEMRYGALDTETNLHSLFLQKEGVKPETPNHQNLIRDIDSSEKTNLFTYSSIDSLVDIVREEFMKIMGESLEDVSNNTHEKTLDIQDRVLYQKSEGYINVGDYKKQLDEFIESDSPALVVAGETGCGKTSLLASWIKENAHRFTHTIHYFVGEEEGSTNHLDIQKFIIREIERIYGLDFEIEKIEKDDMEEALEDFSYEVEKALKEMESHGDTLLLVIDGINYIDQGAINKLLIWLPEIPKGVKMIVSTNPADLTFYSLTETKGYPVIEIDDLKKSEVAQIANSYLAKFGKSLDPKLIFKIADNEIFHKNSILKILLDDLISYGVHEELPEQIDKYAKSKSVEDFFMRIIERAETFYGKERIKKLLLLLNITKNGLEESDIRDVLGLTPLEWSEIYCGLINYLIFIDGKYLLRYPEFAAAIESRYSKAKPSEIISLREGIISVLKDREDEESEIAFQAYNLDDHELLHATLAPFEVMAKLVLPEERYFFEYWNFLKENGYSFREYLDNMPQDKEYLGERIILITNAIDLKLNDIELVAEFVEKYLLLLSEEDQVDKAIIYIYLARLYNKYIDIEKSESYAIKAKEIYDSLPDIKEYDYWEYYLVNGMNLSKRKEYEKALEAFDHSLKLARMDEDHEEIDEWHILNMKGLALLSLHRYDEAIKFFEKSLDLVCSFMTSKLMEPSLIINNLGYCYLEKGDCDRAEEYLTKALQQLSEIFGSPNLEMFLPISNLIETKIRQQDYQEAKEILEYLLAILDDSEQAYDYQYIFVYNKFGEVETALGNKRKARKWLKKAAELKSEIAE